MATIRKKHRAPVSVFQRDPGPWSRLLIDWLATLAVIIIFGLVMLFSASYTTGYLRMGDSFHYIKQQALCMMLGAGLYVPYELCGPPLFAQDGGAGLHHRAGHAGRHPDHGTPERLPPLDPLRRAYAAILGGSKV